MRKQSNIRNNGDDLMLTKKNFFFAPKNIQLSQLAIEFFEGVCDPQHAVSRFYSSQNIKVLQKKIKYKFKKKNNLLSAFSHKSFINELKIEQLSSYEKLEYLGDSVLNLIVTEKIYSLYPNLQEGNLSKLRGALVNEQSLATLAKLIDLNSVVLVGRGERQKLGHERDSILADCLESMIGAIYLEAGLKKAQEVLENIFLLYQKEEGKLFLSNSKLETFDYKSKLQEWSYREYKKLPQYLAKRNSQGLYEVQLLINEKLVSTMIGTSKKNCEKDLAKQYLESSLLKENLC